MVLPVLKRNPLLHDLARERGHGRVACRPFSCAPQIRACGLNGVDDGAGVAVDHFAPARASGGPDQRL
jgi:hypothetical protein